MRGLRRGKRGGGRRIKRVRGGEDEKGEEGRGEENQESEVRWERYRRWRQ